MTRSRDLRPMRPWVCMLLFGALLAAGCSTSNTDSGANLVDAQGNHPAGWIAAHPAAALPDGSACVPCHGSVTSAAESGGISGVSCFLASRNGQGCHANGPSFTGVHAVPFLASAHFQADNTSFAAGCSNCHAIALPDASPLPTAPLCTGCHGTGVSQPLLAQSPLSFPNCTSCHSRPPDGVTYPNVAGTHVLHNAFAGVTGICDTCHSGKGSGTPDHYNRANARPGRDALRVPPGDVTFMPNFNPPPGSGTATFIDNALTCTNVSCHGGQTTPSWQGGVIDVNAQCGNCHKSSTVAPPQFNDYVSGRHVTHVQFFVPANLPGVVPTCLACHDTAKLADPAVGAHFDNLVTTAIETRASVTIGGGTTHIDNYVAGAQPGTGTCTPTPTSPCHAARGW